MCTPQTPTSGLLTRKVVRFSRTPGCDIQIQIPLKLGLNEKLSYAELGKRCGLTEAATRHVIRAAISIRFFEEPEDNVVAHNAFSQALITTPGVMDWVGFCTDDVAPAAAKWAESLQKYPGSEETTQAGVALANGGKGKDTLHF